MLKKPTNDEKIAAAMEALNRSIIRLEKFGSRYDKFIDDAALHNNDTRAKQLILQKLRIYALAEQLQTLKGNLTLGVYTAQVMSDLGKLPDAIAGCQGLLSESPNFSKLGKSIEKIFQEMSRPESEIAKLNQILDGILTPAASTDSTFDDTLTGDAELERSDRFQAEYSAMVERLKTKVAPAGAVAKPAPAPTSDATGEIDYAGIVDEENKKK